MRENLVIKRLLTYNEFLSLKGTWNKLLKSSTSDTIFLTYEWVKAWIDNFLGQDELYILTAYTQDNKLIGIAPLCLRKSKALKVFTLTTVAFLGDRDGGSEYLDFITKKGREEQVCEAFFQYLKTQKKSYDLFYLKEIPETSPNIEYMKQFAKNIGLKHSAEPRVCSQVQLPDSWDEYLKMLKPRFRTKIRSARRRLLEEHKVNFFILEKKEELDQSLITLFYLHQKKWVSIGETGSFYRIAKRNFYRDIAHPFLRNGWLSFFILKINGESKACQFSFLYKNEILHLQEGYDPDWNEKEIGNVLRGYVMEYLLKEGIKVYDFLGGITFHKKTWGAREKYSYHLTLLKKSNIKLFFSFRLIKLIKKLLKRLLPKKLIEIHRQKQEQKYAETIKKREKELLNIKPPFRRYNRKLWI